MKVFKYILIHHISREEKMRKKIMVFSVILTFLDSGPVFSQEVEGQKVVLSVLLRDKIFY